MLLAAGAAHVTALEPSDAFEVLRANTAQFGDRVLCQRRGGDEIDPEGGYDGVYSVGVLHFVAATVGGLVFVEGAGLGAAFVVLVPSLVSGVGRLVPVPSASPSSW